MKEWRKAFNAWLDALQGTVGLGGLRQEADHYRAFEAGLHAGVLSQTEAQDAKRSTEVVGHVVERVYDCGVGDGLLKIPKIPWRP